MTSPGIRSGVNCTRLADRLSAAASVLASNVLATPGTPSSSTWPSATSAISRPVTTWSWPTTALATSARTASSASAGIGVGHDCRSFRSRVSSSAARETSAWSVVGGGPCNSAGHFSRWQPGPGRDSPHPSPRWSAGQPGHGQASDAPAGGGAQFPGRPVAGTSRLVQAAVPLHGLGSPHHHRQPLGYQRAEPPRPPRRREQRRDAQLDRDQVDGPRNQRAERPLPGSRQPPRATGDGTTQMTGLAEPQQVQAERRVAVISQVAR